MKKIIKIGKRKRVITLIDEHDATDQSHKEDCDVNNIIKRYMKTGEISHLSRTQGIYGDFSEITDLKESMELSKYAEEEFLKIPAEIRKKFGNDPTQLVEWLQNPENTETAIQYGLMERLPEKQNDQTKQKQEVPSEPVEK